jgi:DNA-binding transcriptional regulator YiaG
VPSYLTITAELTKLIKKQNEDKTAFGIQTETHIKNQTNCIKWTPEAENAFIKIKELLRNPSHLTETNFSKTIGICTDASKVAIGGYIFQHGKKAADKKNGMTTDVDLNPTDFETIQIISHFSRTRNNSK